MRHHDTQQAYRASPARFCVVPAGRRSGKTELAKRKLVRATLYGSDFARPRYFAAAPTRDQAKRIYWTDLKALMPREYVTDISETELRISVVTGAELHVVGLDKPERIEGSPWDGGVLDEYGNMKAKAWPENVRPALADRNGWCDMIGVPEGRNHYFDLWQQAATAPDWARYHWKSADILPADEVEAARRDLDELTFQQEYEGSFVSFEGRCYYPFTDADHCARLRGSYDPAQPLIFCYDFNVAPGVCVIAQEQEFGTAVIGEVYIPRNSNTPAVCRKLVQDWGSHTGRVICYGDATGGASGSAQVAGSDWDIVRRELRPQFGDRVTFRVPKANPRERARVNAVNARLKAGDGTVRLKVDPVAAPHVVRDLEGVTLLAGGSGEIDKRADVALTHISDGLGYYIAEEFPIRSRAIKKRKLVGI
jgi:hypothetical protein